jgi:hypothetical protein
LGFLGRDGQSFGENVVIISAGRGSLNRQKKRRENISLASMNGGEEFEGDELGGLMG